MRIGIVLIGRNEGERLRLCLRSCSGRAWPVVYADSGSVDGSLELARSFGAETVVLDPARPYTMARGRNAGLARLLELAPDVECVLFIDGDCELEEQFVERASAELTAHSDVVAVFGRRRERFRDANIYHRLADMEWNAPLGEARACAGDVLMRVHALRAAGGYDESLIAGEEAELCIHLRRAGGRILRIDAPMTVHDVAISRFGQWWRRAVRSGWTYASGAWMHGAAPERHLVRKQWSALVWGLVVPAAAVGLAWPTRGLSLLLFLGHARLSWRVARWRRQQFGDGTADAALYARFCVLAKLPEALGVLRFHFDRLRRRRAVLIEYKAPRSSVS